MLCCGCKADSCWLYDDAADQNLGGECVLIYSNNLKTTVTYDLLLGGLPLQKHKPNQVWNIPILLFRVGKILSQSDAPVFFGIKDTSHIWQM